MQPCEASVYLEYKIKKRVSNSIHSIENEPVKYNKVKWLSSKNH